MATDTLEVPSAAVQAPDRNVAPGNATNMTLREQVIAAENDFQKQQENQLNAEMDQLRIVETPDEPLKEAAEPADQIEEKPPVEPENETEADLTELPRDEKGRLIMRETRAKALFADRAELRALKSELAKFQVEEMRGNGKEPGKPSEENAPVDPVKAIEARIAEAEKSIEDADNQLDKLAEDFADAATKAPIRAKQRAAIKVLAEAQAEMKILKARGEDSQNQARQNWISAVKKAEDDNKELRDNLFNQDRERFPDLKNENSQHYRVTEAILAHWCNTGDRDLLAPDAQRLAAEKAARHLGIKIPAVPSTNGNGNGNGTPKPSDDPSAAAAALRTRGKVIAGGSRAAPTHQPNAAEVFANMGLAEKRAFLIKHGGGLEP